MMSPEEQTQAYYLGKKVFLMDGKCDVKLSQKLNKNRNFPGNVFPTLYPPVKKSGK